jgi:shikimate dehydrogenase
MIKTILIGNPVEHSVAPVLHTEFARTYGMSPNEFSYIKTEVKSGQISETLTALELLGFTGGNVTLPIKLEVMQYLEVNESAGFIGAVNTFVLRDGKRYGFNTDWQGVTGALEHSGLDDDKRESFVVLGSGGAARAAIYAAKQLGFKKTVVFYEEPVDDKTRDLQERATELGIIMYPYDSHLEEELDGASVIYNTTSTGMVGFDPAPFDLKRLSAIDLTNAIVADTIFNPLDTPFLKAARDRKAAMLIDGIWWTIFQGIPSFTHWTGKKLDLGPQELSAIHELMVAAIGRHS